MATKKIGNAARAGEFYDALAEVVLTMGAQEIRSEMQAEGLDPAAEAKKTRHRLLDSLARSQAEEIKDAVSSLLRRTAKAVSDIVASPMAASEKRHLLEVTFAKASTESQLDMGKVVEALDNLTDEEKRLLNDSIGHMLRKD